MCFLSLSGSPATGSIPAVPGVSVNSSHGLPGGGGAAGEWDTKLKAGNRHFLKQRTCESLVRPGHFGDQTVEED